LSVRTFEYSFYFIVTYNLGQNKTEQLTPFSLQSNDEGAKEQKRAILASLKWGEWVAQMFHLFCPRCNLGQNKEEQLTPFPGQSNKEGAYIRSPYFGN